MCSNDKFIRTYEKDPKDYDAIIKSLNNVIKEALLDVSDLYKDDIAQDIRLRIWDILENKDYFDDKTSEHIYFYIKKTIYQQVSSLKKKSFYKNLKNEGRNYYYKNDSNTIDSDVFFNIKELRKECSSIKNANIVIDHLTGENTEKYGGLTKAMYYRAFRKIKSLKIQKA